MTIRYADGKNLQTKFVDSKKLLTKKQALPARMHQRNGQKSCITLFRARLERKRNGLLNIMAGVRLDRISCQQFRFMLLTYLNMSHAE
jgi:hypothetical protein